MTRRATAIMLATVLAAFAIALTLQTSDSRGTMTTRSAPDNLTVATDRSNAAWYRIAALTVQIDAALEALLFEHRCRPYGSSPSTDEQTLFGKVAIHEALSAARLMWPHVYTLSPVLSKYYWPLRFRLGQIAQAQGEEKSELVCRPDFFQIRSRWNLALSGSMPGVNPPFEWETLQRLGALRRIGDMFDRAVETTCHSLDATDVGVTSNPVQVSVLQLSLANARATLRSAPMPSSQRPGAAFLWQGTQRGLREWSSDLERSLEDGVRRHVCGHLLYQVLWGAYHTWLSQDYDDDEAMKLDLLLRWTQLEVRLRQICDFPKSDASPLILFSIDRFVSPVRTVVPLPIEFRPPRDDVVVAVQDWLPSPERVRWLQFESVVCPYPGLPALSTFLTDLAALPAVTD